MRKRIKDEITTINRATGKIGTYEKDTLTRYEFYHPEDRTFAALGGLRFTRSYRIYEDGREVYLVDKLDAQAYWSFGKLCAHCDKHNAIVINKESAQHHWKYAKSYKDLKMALGIKSGDTFSKVMQQFKKYDVIAKITVNGRTAYYINPLYYSNNPDYFINLDIIRAFKDSIKAQIGDQDRIRDIEKLLAEKDTPTPAADKKPVFDITAVDLSALPPLPENDLATPAPIIEEAVQEEDSEQLAMDEIFSQYVLDGQDFQIWHEEKWVDKNGKKGSGYFLGPVPENEFFTPNIMKLENARGKGRTKDNAVAIRNIFIDIDAGKTADKKYLSDEEVARRKVAMNAFIHNYLPCCTAIVETRNGYHCYWSIDSQDREAVKRGKNLQRKMVELVNIADQAAKDVSRLLRVPGSIHHKEGLAPYNVEIVEATPVSYTMEDLEAILDNTAEKIGIGCAEYRIKCPDYEALANAFKLINSKETAAPARPVARKKVIPLPKVKAINGTVAYSEAVNYIKANIDMRDFLEDAGFSCSGSKFCCVLPGHDDETGDASIYSANDKGQAYDVYVCHCPGTERGLDIIGLYRMMYGASFGEALSKLAAYLGVRIVADGKKVA